MAEFQRAELLRQARDNAKSLLEGLERDQPTVAGMTDGPQTFKSVIDATRDTLDNLNRALQEAPASTGPN